MTSTGADQAAAETFAQRVETDLTGMATILMCVLGDRLDLFDHLEAAPATSGELAARASIDERYAREWLSALASGGYLQYDPSSRRFSLPAAHAPVLVEEGNRLFHGGAFQIMAALSGVLDPLGEAFRKGGGVTQATYSDHLWDGMERDTNCWVQNALLQAWIPAMPDVAALLERGCLMADVGCGRGGALIKLAQAYPSSRFVGYDVFAPTVARANDAARSTGVDDRVRFVAADVARGLPEMYDLIATFDVVHDAVDPLGLLRGIRSSLRPGGIYLALDIKASDTLEEHAGQQGAYYYAISVLYCMTTSLAGGGAGLGTLGLSETTMRALCGEAGFGRVRLAEIDDPYHNLYEIRLS